MIEKSTRSESVNPYVRRWGCDLISPEPHKKEKTFRRERKEMPKQVIWKQPPRGGVSVLPQGGLTQTGPPSEAATESEHDHDLSAHITDMDQLLGRAPHQDGRGGGGDYEGTDYMNQTASTALDGTMEMTEDDCPQRTATPVIWPPLAPSPTPQEPHPSRVPVVHRGSPERPPPPQRHHQPPPPPAMLLDNHNLVGSRSKTNKDIVIGRSLSTENRNEDRHNLQPKVNGASSLSEIDQQISTIQNEFEAELDGLIDAYRKVQNTSAPIHKSATTTASQGWFEHYKS